MVFVGCQAASKERRYTKMTNLAIQSVGIDPLTFLTSARNSVQQFAGRIWTHLNKISQYTQDPRAALGYLVVANLVAFQIGIIVKNIFQYFFPPISEEGVETADFDHPPMRKTAIELASTLIGCGVTWGSLHAMIDRAQIPFKTSTILCVSIPILLGRALLEYHWNRTKAAAL